MTGQQPELTREYAIRLPNGDLFPNRVTDGYGNTHEIGTRVYTDAVIAERELDELRHMATRLGVTNLGASLVWRVVPVEWTTDATG
jgi:hypothetical protein